MSPNMLSIPSISYLILACPPAEVGTLGTVPRYVHDRTSALCGDAGSGSASKCIRHVSLHLLLPLFRHPKREEFQRWESQEKQGLVVACLAPVVMPVCLTAPKTLRRARPETRQTEPQNGSSSLLPPTRRPCNRYLARCLAYNRRLAALSSCLFV
ncbi:hypothetical protein LZ32DRAFT_607827 [Colletotrichum eremochloae]|nr:hypothetical protein LZ32DRAFT_607827 [Colletotrichum eremochloae]